MMCYPVKNSEIMVVSAVFAPINTKIYLKISFQLTHFMMMRWLSCGNLILMSELELSLNVGIESECHWCTVAGYT